LLWARASIAPATGVIGAIVPVTLTGTNLTGASLNLEAALTATCVLAPGVTLPETMTVITVCDTPDSSTFLEQGTKPPLRALWLNPDCSGSAFC
jgi:hypothetical protein